MKILITGGAGFVGSHVAEYYANKGDEVIVFDNLSRAELLDYEKPFFKTFKKSFIKTASQKESFTKEKSNVMYNWNYLKRYEKAQTAVTTSLINPRTDFEINALGTFNVLEAARMSENNPCVIYCSTNKVYGDNVNKETK